MSFDQMMRNRVKDLKVLGFAPYCSILKALPRAPTRRSLMRQREIELNSHEKGTYVRRVEREHCEQGVTNSYL